MSFRVALFLLLGCLCGEAFGKAVFANFLIGNTYGYTQSSFQSDMVAAQAAGIDAFGLTIGSDDWTMNRVTLAYQAAQVTGFKVFLIFDMSRHTTVGDISNWITTFGTSSAQFKIGSLVFVSTVGGENVNLGASNSNNGWVSVRQNVSSQGISLYFAPGWSAFDATTVYTNNPTVDAIFYNAPWPGPAENATALQTTDNFYISKATAAGKKYMAGVSPVYFSHLSYANYLYRTETLWFDRWITLLTSSPEFIMIVTWNDWGGSSYIGSIDPIANDLPSGSDAYVSRFPHDAFRGLLPAFTSAYKSGATSPTISQDVVFYWYRPSFAAAVVCPDSLGLPGLKNRDTSLSGLTLSQAFGDKVFVVALLTAASQVTITNANATSNTNTYSLPAGASVISSFLMTIAGQFSVSVTRGGSSIGSSIGTLRSVSSNGPCNFNFYVNNVTISPATISSSSSTSVAASTSASLTLASSSTAKVTTSSSTAITSSSSTSNAAAAAGISATSSSSSLSAATVASASSSSTTANKATSSSAAAAGNVVSSSSTSQTAAILGLSSSTTGNAVITSSTSVSAANAVSSSSSTSQTVANVISSSSSSSTTGNAAITSSTSVSAANAVSSSSSTSQTAANVISSSSSSTTKNSVATSSSSASVAAAAAIVISSSSSSSSQSAAALVVSSSSSISTTGNRASSSSSTTASAANSLTSSSSASVSAAAVNVATSSSTSTTSAKLAASTSSTSLITSSSSSTSGSTTGTTPAPSTKAVFAHFMMGNTYAYNQTMFQNDMLAAQTAGIDAFALNIGHDDWTWAQVNSSYKAAAAVGFKVFLSFDMNYYSTVAEIQRWIIGFGTLPAQYKYKNRVYVSTFAGEGVYLGASSSNAGWQNVKSSVYSASGIDFYFAPDWSGFDANTVYANNPVADAIFYWASWTGPTENSTSLNTSDLLYLSKASAAGKQYMAGVSPWFFTHLSNKNYLYKMETLWYDRWQTLLTTSPDFIEIISWNDWGESHYIGAIDQNVGDLPSGSYNYVNKFSHEAFRATLPMYISAYKNGATSPVVSADLLVYWYRPSFVANVNCNDGIGMPTVQNRDTSASSFTPSQVLYDKVFVMAFMTSTAQVTVASVNTPSNTNTFTANAGVTMISGFTMTSAGTYRVSFARNGNVIRSNVGNVSVASSNGPCNFNVYANSV